MATINYYTTPIGPTNLSSFNIGIQSYSDPGICKNGKILKAAYIDDVSGALIINTGESLTNAPETVSNTYLETDTLPIVAKELNDALENYYKALFAYAAWTSSATPKHDGDQAELKLPAFDYRKKLDGSPSNSASNALNEVKGAYNEVRKKMMKLSFLNSQSSTNQTTQQQLEQLQKDLDTKLLDLQGGPTSKFADMPEQLNTSMYTGLFWSVLAVSAVFVAFSQLG